MLDGRVRHSAYRMLNANDPCVLSRSTTPAMAAARYYNQVHVKYIGETFRLTNHCSSHVIHKYTQNSQESTVAWIGVPKPKTFSN